MNILLVSQYDIFNPAAGGPVYKVRAITDHLARRGHSVTIITAASTATRRDQSPLGVIEDRVKIIHLWTLFRYRAITFNPGIWTVARREAPRADVVHLFGFYDLLGPAVARAARAHGIPYVLEPIGMFVPIVRSLGKKRLYHFWQERALMKGVARVVATSPQEKYELIEAGIPEVKIVERRNGLDLSEFTRLPEHGRLRREFGIVDDERVILYLSRLSHKKNPDLLLRAFAELDLPNIRLVIAGPDEDGFLRELQDLRATLGLDKSVIFTGPLYGEDKVAALLDADIFVLPSQNENFGNVIAESIAVGTPVVITDQCGIAPYVRDRAGLVVPVESSAVRDAMARLLTDSALYKTFENGCESVARELSWEEPVDQMEALYGELFALNSVGVHASG